MITSYGYFTFGVNAYCNLNASTDDRSSLLHQDKNSVQRIRTLIMAAPLTSIIRVPILPLLFGSSMMPSLSLAIRSSTFKLMPLVLAGLAEVG